MSEAVRYVNTWLDEERRLRMALQLAVLLSSVALGLDITSKITRRLQASSNADC